MAPVLFSVARIGALNRRVDDVFGQVDTRASRPKTSRDWPGETTKAS
jgi:hypothetical protein